MTHKERKILEDAGLIYPSVVTNADRIRQMTDEELAEWMATKVTCMRCPVEISVCQNAYYDKEGKCYRILLDWLKAPVEEVQDGT